MWGGRLLQAGFVAPLPLCFSFFLSAFTCRRELPGPCSSAPEHTGVANRETCSPLISAQCLSPAAGLGGKPLPFSILLPSVARGAALSRAGGWAWGAKLRQQSYAVTGGLVAWLPRDVPVLPPADLGTPQSVRRPCLCVPVGQWSCADKQTSLGEAGERQRMLTCGLREQMSCWSYGVSASSALQITSPSLGHGGHSHVLVGLENSLFHPLLVGYSQPWTGM